MLGKMNNFVINEQKFKEDHYEYLTTFAYVETLMSYIISSYFCENNDEKMEFTTTLLMGLSRPRLFQEFLLVLEKMQIQKDEIFSEFVNLNNLRNDFAHSYFVPKKHNLIKGFEITKIHSSKSYNNQGFVKIIQDNEYNYKINQLNNMKEKLYNIYINIQYEIKK